MFLLIMLKFTVELDALLWQQPHPCHIYIRLDSTERLPELIDLD